MDNVNLAAAPAGSDTASRKWKRTIVRTDNVRHDYMQGKRSLSVLKGISISLKES